MEINYDISGTFAVVVSGNSADVTVCDAGGLVGRAVGRINPDHPFQREMIAAIQASYFLGEPIRIFFQSTPGQPCKVAAFNQER